MQRHVQDYELEVTRTTASGIHSANTVTSAPLPVKMDPSGLPLQPIGTQTAPMNFDGGWETDPYMFTPMLDQFPDYDWAASFDFSNDPSQISIPQLQQPVHIGPMTTGPGGNQYG